MRFEGQTALLTGAARGIGKAIARKLASEGCYVEITDIDEKAIDTAVRGINDEFPGFAGGSIMDVTDTLSIRQIVTKLKSEKVRIDILVNNAGANGKSWVVDLDEKLWQTIIQTNLTGTFLCSKAVLPGMIENRKGRIVNVASIAGKQGESAGSAYCSSKFGVIGFTQSLALEVADKNVLVNAVCPGPIQTELGELGINQDAALRGLDPDEFRQWFIDRTPFKRQGTVEQVANMVAFIVSDECDFTTGAAFNVNGGIIMH